MYKRRTKNSPLLIKRNASIINEYKKLCDIKTEKGKAKYSEAYIMEKLEEKFYLEESTLYNIIKGK